MGKAGFILVWAMLLMVVVGILLGGFFLNTINENALVKRHVASKRAFWLAEAGLAEALHNLPSNIPETSLPLGNINYVYNATTGTPFTVGVSNYYNVAATGTVTLPSVGYLGGSVKRDLAVVVRATPPDSSKFQHAIRTTVVLDISGSVEINGDTEDSAALDFPDLFNSTKAEMEAMATNSYTNPPNNIAPVAGITWINLTEGSELKISDNGWTGSGILVVSGGDVHITGGEFDGILYVVGDLFISGNPTIDGSVLVESDTSLVDDIDVTGNPTINFDTTEISTALSSLGFASSEIVSWKEQ